MSKVTGVPVITYCPDIELSFANVADGSPIDPAIFSVDATNAPTDYVLNT